MKDFTAHISPDSDPQRAAVWRMVFDADEVPLRSPVGAYAMLPERGQTLVYDLDIAALTAEQRTRLVLHISGRFGIPAEEVEAQLDTIGCPILAEDVTIAIHNPQRWIDFDDDLDDDLDDDEAWPDDDDLDEWYGDHLHIDYDLDDEDLFP